MNASDRIRFFNIRFARRTRGGIAAVAVAALTLAFGGAAAAEHTGVKLSTGTVVVKTSAVISAKVASYVRKINADVGGRVKKGQALIELDGAEFEAGAALARARLAGAGAVLEAAELHFRRIESLLAKGSATQSAYDKARADYLGAKAAVALARAELDSAEVFLGYATLVSPIDGVVDFKKIEVGELTSPGQPLLKVVDTQNLRFETTVKESEIGGIEPGMAVVTRIEALGDREVAGKVAHVVPTGDRTSHSYTVRIDLEPTDGLMAGMYGKIRWP